VPVNSLLPGNSVVNITNITIDNNQIVFLINLRIPTSKLSEVSIQDINIDDSAAK
jgi:hypothetical protein